MQKHYYKVVIYYLIRAIRALKRVDQRLIIALLYSPKIKLYELLERAQIASKTDAYITGRP